MPPPCPPAGGGGIAEDIVELMFLATMLHWGEIAAGLALLLIVLYDIFQSVVLPRPAINKLATVRYLVRGIYWVWRWVGQPVGSVSPRGGWVAGCRPGA